MYERTFERFDRGQLWVGAAGKDRPEAEVTDVLPYVCYQASSRRSVSSSARYIRVYLK
jgi:hypothetical protein